MAESFLFSIAESLVGKLASRAYEEAFRLFGVYDDLQEFKETLSYIKEVLLDAEKKQEHSYELRKWLKRIKHVLSDAENVLDEVECESLRKKVFKDIGTINTKVSYFFSSSNPLVFRYSLAQQIKEIRERLEKIAADRDKFGLVRIDVDRRVVHRRETTYSHVNSDVIGRDFDKIRIIRLLLQPCHDCNDKTVPVIPIVGIGGLGKTTLAKLVFNDKSITKAFPLKIWVCVSDDFDIKQLIVKVISSASNFASVEALSSQQNLKTLDTEQLQNHLRSKLAGQKFLLVLDDVWNEDRVKWVEFRDLLQVGAKGSRILLTTRSHNVASLMGTVPSHTLSSLSPEYSLSLFVKWAFKKEEKEKYPNLVAVRTLGSLLFSKHEIHEWESVRDNEIWSLPQGDNHILSALKVSYDQMPSYLRQCFAIFSLFPKNHAFNSLEVTSLWSALGLLPLPNRSRTLQDVANQYFDELISRSFLQDIINLGTSYWFTMHDLVHDLALYIAKDECLIVNSRIQDISEDVQHLSFVENFVLCDAPTKKSAGLRTILFPIKGVGANDQGLLNILMSCYKYLRILDLSDSTYQLLPHAIGKLKHLRYLSLSNNKMLKRLPYSIGMLQSLQVLNLDGCTELELLPKELRYLINLQILSITTKQSVLPESDIANLSSLEHLSIQGCDNLESLFVETKHPTLKTLEVTRCRRLKSLPLDINHFPQLETLAFSDGDSSLLEGFEDKNSNLRLKSLALKSLPSLLTLPHWLQASADTLQSLLIYDCHELGVLPEWLSNMSFLKSFIIENCPTLNNLPCNVHRLRNLETLHIVG